MTKSVRLRIRGRVQAVGFRAWAIFEAEASGLRGWVRNRRDGSVEALLIGAEEGVAAMIDACSKGPPAARVTAVEIGEAEDDGSAGFTPRPTL